MIWAGDDEYKVKSIVNDNFSSHYLDSRKLHHTTHLPGHILTGFLGATDENDTVMVVGN